jgi:type I site-specific restriction-modification system R (restriction) subunit
MNYLDEFGLSDDDIKAIDEGIEDANKFLRPTSLLKIIKYISIFLAPTRVITKRLYSTNFRFLVNKITRIIYRK